MNLEEEEAGGVEYDGEEDETDNIDMRWCLVGKFLVDIPVDFNTMQNTLADKGMYVK